MQVAARMLAGDSITKEARAAARSLLERAKQGG
jgi:DNA repair ATPase RecN